MGSFEMKNNGTEKGLVEINYHKLYTHKEVKGGFVGQRQGQSVEEESKINEVIEAIHSERERTMGAQDGIQKMQQQPQPPGPVVCWERFLPLRSLKVLLVVNDDSTRHVISALLRNCSYEVAAAANGVHAWKILQDPTNHIDLVLTEVVMPCLSGIGLLCKIMSHNTFKNIPVIMMSSHDSMGIVFKCLSKGAVDFLVKPIRKNELKNLWQHVWRRCHSSSGSRSESGISPQQNAKSNSVERSDNNTGSNDEGENDSVESGVREGSDNGSGTQSSCTKQAVEVDSPEQMSSWQQPDLPYSKCPRSILSKNEGLDSNWVPLVTKDKQQEEEEKFHDNVQVGKDTEIRVLGNPDLQNEDASDQIYTNLTRTQDNLLELELSKDYLRSKEGSMELNRGVPIGESRTHAAKDNNNIALISNCVDKRIETNLSEAPFGLYKVSDIKNTITSDTRESLSLELSLKRLRGTGDVGRDDHDERNVLRRTNLSAFSRYNSSDAMKADSTYNQQSNGSSNYKRMASTTKNNAVKLSALDEQSAATSAAICLHPSAIRPVQNEGICPPQQILPQKADNVIVTTLVEQPGGVHQQVQVEHHHHHYHHHHHHVHDKKEQHQQQEQEQEQEQPENDDSSHDIRSGSSNLFGSLEGNGGNYSLNGSVSGSNHGSSVPNGSSKTVNIGGMNIESDNGKSEAGAGSGSGSGSGTEPNRLTQREAALNKFRQKRKDRCFEKKVRYQSRKTLAEQRPRVRGQFVRQEHTSQDEKS